MRAEEGEVTTDNAVDSSPPVNDTSSHSDSAPAEMTSAKTVEATSVIHDEVYDDHQVNTHVMITG